MQRSHQPTNNTELTTYWQIILYIIFLSCITILSPNFGLGYLLQQTMGSCNTLFIIFYSLVGLLSIPCFICAMNDEDDISSLSSVAAAVGVVVGALRDSCSRDGEGCKPPPQDDKSSTNDKKKGDSKLQGTEKGSVIYMAFLQYPREFLATIKTLFYPTTTNVEDRNMRPRPLHIRLGATKIGQSSSVRKFLKKMQKLQRYLPFAKIEYIANVIPPNSNFNSKHAEQAMHFIFMIRNIRGEWFDMSLGMRDWIVRRMAALGCSSFRGTANKNFGLRLNGTDTGSAGHVYFAKVKWSDTDMAMINDLASDFSSTCNKLLSVKIGCGCKMERSGNEDDDDTDSDDGGN